MRFTVLGPVTVVVNGDRHHLPRAQTRGLLALLLLHADRTVSAGAAVEALWGGAAPASARSQVQGSVSAIRRTLAALGVPPLLHSGPAGYRLQAGADDVDMATFEGLTRRARGAAAAGRIDEATQLLRSGLALWQGDPLAGAAGSFVGPTRLRLDDQRLSTVEELADLDLRLGRHAGVAVELAPLVDAYPMRERLRARLMLAWYRDGRRVEALQSFREYRKLLADRVGLDPGAELAALELAILRGEPALTS